MTGGGWHQGANEGVRNRSRPSGREPVVPPFMPRLQGLGRGIKNELRPDSWSPGPGLAGLRTRPEALRQPARPGQFVPPARLRGPARRPPRRLSPADGREGDVGRVPTGGGRRPRWGGAGDGNSLRPRFGTDSPPFRVPEGRDERVRSTISRQRSWSPAGGVATLPGLFPPERPRVGRIAGPQLPITSAASFAGRLVKLYRRFGLRR